MEKSDRFLKTAGLNYEEKAGEQIQTQRRIIYIM